MELDLQKSYIAALLVVAPIVLCACGGKEERRALHLEKGKTYYEQGNLEKARIELKNVLQIDPKSAEAYYLSGLIEEKQQNWQKALGNYRKTVELDPNQIQAKAKLGRLYLLSGALNEAEQLTSEILATQPADPAGRTLRAMLMARKGESSGALQEAREIVAAEPTQTDAVALLAKLYSNQGDDAKAQETLTKSVAVSPMNVPLRLELASVLIKRGQLKETAQQLKDVIAIEPSKLEHRVSLAQFYSRSNQLDKAETALRETISQDLNDERRYLLLAEFLATRKGAPEQAERELLSAIDARPKAYQLRFGLAKLYQAMNKPEKARQVYDGIIKLSKDGPEGLGARNQLARIHMTSDNIAEAETLIAEVLKVNAKDNEALLLRGQIWLAKSEAKNAIADFRRVLKDYAGSAEVTALLAKAHLANNEPQLARDVLDNAVIRYPQDPNIRLAMAAFLSSMKEYDRALKEVDAALALDAANARAFQLKADLLIEKKDWRAAEAAMAGLKTALPNDPLGYYRLGLIYHAQRKYDKAISEFEIAQKKAPHATEHLVAIVNSLKAQGKVPEALTRINQAIALAPDNATLHVLLGKLYQEQGNYGGAEAAFLRAIETNPRASAPYVELSNLYLARADSQSAIRVLLQGLDASSGDPMLRASLAETYHRAGEYDKAISEYEGILKKNPASDVAANNLASILTELRGDKASLERARKLAKRFENASNPAFMDTLGWIYVKLEQPDLALPLLQKALEAAPQVPVLEYHLGMAFYKKGDLSSAKNHFQKALSAKTNFVGIEEAREMLAKL